MTIFNVHIYREIRLLFGGIESESHEAAAAIAHDKPTGDADEIDECDGETFYACVDVKGDEEYEQSRWVLFEADRLRDAASQMLEALQAFIEANELAEECHEWKWENLDHAFKLARAAVAEATAGPHGVPA